MGFALRQTELHLEPAVGFLAGHKALHPEPVQRDMGLPPLLTQEPVCQRTHRQVAVPVGGHIGIAGGEAGTDVDLLAGCGVLMYHRRRPETRLGTAVGALDVEYLLSFANFLWVREPPHRGIPPQKPLITAAFCAGSLIRLCGCVGFIRFSTLTSIRPSKSENGPLIS